MIEHHLNWQEVILNVLPSTLPSALGGFPFASHSMKVRPKLDVRW